MLKEEVWGYRFSGLGDLWATANYLLQLPREPIAYSCKAPHIIQTITTINSLLDTKKVLRPVSVPPNRFIDIGCCFKSAYLPTKKRWACPSSTTISYQLDGRSDGHLKNLSPKEESRLLAFLSDLGYTPINVGGGRPLPSVVNTMAAACLHRNTEWYESHR